MARAEIIGALIKSMERKIISNYLDRFFEQ